MNTALAYRLLPDNNGDELRDGKMGFLEHLDELRVRIIRSCIAVAVGMIVAFAFIDRIVTFVLAPSRRMLPPGARLYHWRLSFPIRLPAADPRGHETGYVVRRRAWHRGSAARAATNEPQEIGVAADRMVRSTPHPRELVVGKNVTPRRALEQQNRVVHTAPLQEQRRGGRRALVHTGRPSSLAACSCELSIVTNRSIPSPV
jgi:hypothetical protein